MARNRLRLLLILIYLCACHSLKYRKRRNYSPLINFTCATVKDELEKHPEMRTVAMVELENNFPSEFSREVLKCLPVDVAKVVINPHTHVYGYPDRNSMLMLPKHSMVLYVADSVDYWTHSFTSLGYTFYQNFPVVSHLSKQLIISSRSKVNESSIIFDRLLNIVQICEENRRVIARSFDITKNLTTFETFESSQRENLSQILFPDKAKNLNGQKIHIAWSEQDDLVYDIKSQRPVTKWTFFLDIIASRLNASLNFIEIARNQTTTETFEITQQQAITELIIQRKFDFHLNGHHEWKFGRLESYNRLEWCFVAPLPEPYSITELILFLPMDKSCWMWLCITIAVSTLIWRISEGHWNFAFGAFSYFMGQAQLSVRIRTNRLTMKILLQLLIFAIFIFSNGYQSLVTSFMLNPMEQKLLKSVDEVLESDLNLELRLYTMSNTMELHERLQKPFEDGRVKEAHLLNKDWIKRITGMHFAYAQPCQMIKVLLELERLDKIYLVPEPVYSALDDLFIIHFHNFIDKFQEIMDRSFEAGLHQAWERFYWELFVEGKHKKSTEEKTELDLGLIAPFFLILVFGFVAALLALLCEIFWRDFVMELSGDYFKRKFNELFGIIQRN